MSANQTIPPLFAFESNSAIDADASPVPVNVSSLEGRWHVIAASQGSISRNPQNATETFEVSGTRLISSLRFERLGGSAVTTRRRIFATKAADSLLGLLQSSLDVVYVDDAQAVVAEGGRLRILSRTPDISPRDFFRRVSLSREQGHDADDLRMIPAHRG